MTHTASFSESPESELNFENVILFFSSILINCADLIYDFLKKNYRKQYQLFKNYIKSWQNITEFIK